MLDTSIPVSVATEEPVEDEASVAEVVLLSDRLLFTVLPMKKGS